MKNSSRKRKLEPAPHSDCKPDPRNRVDSSPDRNPSSRRKLEENPPRQRAGAFPLELVDDSEWNAIQSAFAALRGQSQLQNLAPVVTEQTELQNSAPTFSKSKDTAVIPSMVPAILPSSAPPALPSAHHRFYHDALSPGHSPGSWKHDEFQGRAGLSRKAGSGGHSPPASRQVSATTSEGLKERDGHPVWPGNGHGFSNGGQGASPWKMGSRLLPCQFPARKNCVGGGGTTRIQCGEGSPELHSNESTSVEERGKGDFSRPLESQEQFFLPPEMVVGPFPQVSEMVLPTADEGSRELSRKQSTRRLPGWIEPAGRFLLSVEKSRSLVRSRDALGLEVVINSETVEEKQIRRPDAEQLGDVATAPLQTEDGHPAWVQLDQPQNGLLWGFQPSICVANEIKPKFPTIHFRGQIVYSTTKSEVDAATDELWRRVHELQRTTRGAVPIGFDLEWRASFEKGELPGKVAVLQLCLDASRCDVMQIIYSGIPASLQDLLEAPSTRKVGVGIYGDINKLRGDYQISTRKITDLSMMANKVMNNRKQWSLSSLALELTGKQVDKIKSIRCGNWEALPLSEPQLQYAATDAFASLHLYQVLASFPNPENDQSESDDFKSEPELPTTQDLEPES